MSIYKTAIDKPITTALIFVAVIVMGVFCYRQLPIDQYPDIDPPYVSVMTAYAGNNASEIETNVTKVLENTLNSIEGLKEMRSTSKDNISLVTLEFEWGHDVDMAVNDIRSSIDFVYDNLPDGCSRPMVFKFNTSMMPILVYAVTANESYPGLAKILEDNVTNVLNRVDGIGNLSVSGAPDRYVYVDVDQTKLDAYGIPLELVSQAVSSNNINMAAGTVKMGKEQYQLKTSSEYQSSAEIRDIVVTTLPNGKKVFVKDVATVRDTIKDLCLDEKINSKEGCRLVIMKQTGANTVKITDEVKQMMVQIQKTLPPDIQFDILMDSSDLIKSSIDSLTESIMYALLFVVLVVMFFLGQWRAAIIVGVCIPISLVVSFIYLKFIDSSLNVISMSSLTIAIGMVVDDAIVVLENIDKHIQRGSAPREAAIYATNEVWVSVIATTIVTAAVFIPLTFLPGIAGIMFKQLGWIVTITVVTSTTVAISLTPMLSSRMLKARDYILEKIKGTGDGKEKKNLYQRTVIKALDWIDEKYYQLLKVCLRHKTLTILAMVAFFALSLVPACLGYIGMDFMEQNDQGRMSVTYELESGTRIDESIKIARQIEADIVATCPDVRMYSTTIGSDDDAGISSLFSSTTNNKISMTIRTTKRGERKTGKTIFQICDDIRGLFDKNPHIKTYKVSTSSGGATGSNSVDIEVIGYDFDKTNVLAQEIKKRVKNVEGAKDISISREDDRAELQVILDKEKLSQHGLNSQTVAAYIRYRVNGSLVGYLKEDGNEYDIVVRLKEEVRNSIDKIEELTIPTSTGMIKVKELGKVEEYWCPPQIERKNRERLVTVSVTPSEVSLSDLAMSIEDAIADIEVPLGITVNVGGDWEDQKESTADMISLLMLILMLVYIVMASQFESMVKPFIIMMSIPFSFSGVIFALLITNTTLSMVGMLGIILLVGIVIKNGIVLVDYINLQRDRGVELNEAIAISGRSRLRPVLMTAFTTILGMLPMALSKAEGSETWVSMGIVVIGGLTVSTIITLVIVPTLYAVMSKRGERDNKKEIQSNFVFYDMPEGISFDSREQRIKND